MVRLRPDAASYARVAYARELQGQLPEALRLMRMAAEATNPSDLESLAWHDAQIGNILLKMGDIDGAAREFARADYIFPGHPDARDGLAKLRELRASGAGLRPELTCVEYCTRRALRPACGRLKPAPTSTQVSFGSSGIRSD